MERKNMHEVDFVREAEAQEMAEAWDQSGWEEVIFELEELLEEFGSEG